MYFLDSISTNSITFNAYEQSCPNGDRFCSHSKGTRMAFYGMIATFDQLVCIRKVIAPFQIKWRC